MTLDVEIVRCLIVINRCQYFALIQWRRKDFLLGGGQIFGHFGISRRVNSDIFASHRVSRLCFALMSALALRGLVVVQENS